MKYLKFGGLVCVLFLLSCEWHTKPYIQHELEYKKIADGCHAKEGMNMESNTNGERFVLEECLDVDFNKDKMVVERKTDTVLISFRDEGKAKASFALTIDIDTYPAYNYITIGSNTYQVVHHNL